MEMSFERGDSTQPKGHALVYFSSQEGKLLATYIVILPVRVEMGKYLPPLFASQMGDMSGQDFSAFAMPPMPEEMDSYGQLSQLGELRDDDLVYGGILSEGMEQGIQEVNEIVQEYARLYAHYRDRVWSVEGETVTTVDDALYEFLGEKDRLEELSKLMVKMRWAVESSDESLLRETEGAMRALAKYLPEWYKTDELLEAAKDPTNRGAELAKLYVERCYKLANEDYPGVRTVEQAIEKLK